MVLLAMVPVAQAAGPEQTDQVNTGDELVIINASGQLEVRDPYVPTGYQAVSWQSPQNGFTDVITGDFNGDGTDEILGLRGNTVVVYDPIQASGEPSVATVFNADTSQTWTNMVTGNFDADSADEIALVQTRTAGTYMDVYNFTAGSWTRTHRLEHGSAWVKLAAGKILGTAAGNRDQVIGIRNVGLIYQTVVFDPANNWSPAYASDWRLPWINVAVGNVVDDSAGKAELVFERNWIPGQKSYLVMRLDSATTMNVVQQEELNPPFTWLALADVNNSGDDEVYLLRAGIDNRVALYSFNYGSDSAITLSELRAQTQWNGIQAGDFDADGKDEIAVMSPTAYLIYNSPDNATTSTSYAGSYAANGNFAVGDFDGGGSTTGPTLSVSPLTVSVSLQGGQNSTQAITIANSGSGSFNWTATVTSGSGWLSVTPSSGVAPATAQLVIDSSNLASGSYTGTVRIDAAGAANSPQIITVTANITAAQFAVQPTAVFWYYRPPQDPGMRSVRVSGSNVPWHVVITPAAVGDAVEAAQAAGQRVTLQNGVLLADGKALGPQDVAWLTVNPTTGVAVPGGLYVDFGLVPAQLAYGMNKATVIFIADAANVSPSAIVVRVNVVRGLADGSDLIFLPMIVR